MTPPFTAALAAAFINHVLKDAPSARLRLAAQAGKRIAFDLAGLVIRLEIDVAGQMAEADAEKDIHTTIHLTPGQWLRLAMKDDKVVRELRVEGDMQLAQTVSHLAETVRWDVEEDLSKVIGDVAAHRLVKTVREWLDARMAGARSMAHAAVEYAEEEANILAKRRHIEQFVREVDEVREATDRLEKRLHILLNKAK